MKNEVSKFIDRYLMNKENLSFYDVNNVKINLNSIINNIKDFECPDGYSIIGNDCYVFEHFEFDAHDTKKKNDKQSSDFREKDTNIEKYEKQEFDSIDFIAKAGYEYKTINSCITVNSSKDNYVNNFTRVFKNHANKVGKYLQNLKNKKILFQEDTHFCFFIEDKTILGSYYLVNKRPFNICCTKEFIDLWKKHLDIDYLFIALSNVFEEPCYFIDKDNFLLKDFPSIFDLDIFITNSAQITSTQYKINKT